VVPQPPLHLQMVLPLLLQPLLQLLQQSPHLLKTMQVVPQLPPHLLAMVPPLQLQLLLQLLLQRPHDQD